MKKIKQKPPRRANASGNHTYVSPGTIQNEIDARMYERGLRFGFPVPCQRRYRTRLYFNTRQDQNANTKRGIVGKSEIAPRNKPCPCGETKIVGYEVHDGTKLIPPKPIVKPVKAKRCCRNDAPPEYPRYDLEGKEVPAHV